MEEQITNKDILDAINIFSTNMNNRFDGVENRLDGVENRLNGVENRLVSVEKELVRLENKMDAGFDSVRAEIHTEIVELKADLEAQISAIDTRSGEDTCATMKDQLKLEARVEKLEQHVKQLQPA